MCAARPCLAFAVALSLAGQAHADSCRRPAGQANTSGPRDCPREQRVEPYDPDRVKAGSQPGFVDLGNGTEVRVGGRVRLDYDVRR